MWLGGGTPAILALALLLTGIAATFVVLVLALSLLARGLG